MSSDAWGPAGLELVDPAEPPLLARVAVDRCAEHRPDAAWLDRAWAERGLSLTVGPDGTTPPAPGGGLFWERAEGQRPAGALLLGADGDDVFFAEPGPPRLGRGLRELGADLDGRDAGLLTAAVALLQWHAVHGHCPRCGAATEVESAGWVRRCPRDGSQHFPRTDPAVIVLVTSVSGDEAVLGRQPSWPAGRYSCLAGFVEPGESAEQAVVREVKEESGLTVREVTQEGSQPWPFPASLMLGFRAVADRDEAPAATDDELEHVAWFSRDEIRAGAVVLPPPISIANRLFARWLAEG